MTLESLYDEIGGNYANVKARLLKDARIEKFVLLFLEDDSYQIFLRALENGDPEEAFRGIHTLKGVCANLSFDALYRLASAATEALRGGDLSGAVAALPGLETCYQAHLRAIRAYARETAGKELP